MIDNYNKHGMYFSFVPVCNKLVDGISVNDLLPSKLKEKHHLKANILSLTESEFNIFRSPSCILVNLSKNVDVSQENAVELGHDANILSI